jgi:uncharacterized protein (TIGR02453 family)
MGELLRPLVPAIIAEPKTDRSIFRIHRDTRFSRDKRPYKTHLAFLFWAAGGKKLERPGFYFHITPEKYFIAAGMHTFPRPFIPPYRNAVVDRRNGPALQDAVQKVQQAGPYILGWEKYKTIPPGYDAQHSNAAYLLYGGLGFHREGTVDSAAAKAEFAEFCYSCFSDMFPIYDWLNKILEKGS